MPIDHNHGAAPGRAPQEAAGPRRCLRRWVTLAAGALAAPGLATADTTTIGLRATVLEVQCTAEQRLRIRACAPARETITAESAKRLVPMPAVQPARTEHLVYEVRRDDTRVVLVRTVLY